MTILRSSCLRRLVGLTLVLAGYACVASASIPPAIGQAKATRQESRRLKVAREEMQSAYKHWIDEEVPYIITP